MKTPIFIRYRITVTRSSMHEFEVETICFSCCVVVVGGDSSHGLSSRSYKEAEALDVLFLLRIRTETDAVDPSIMFHLPHAAFSTDSAGLFRPHCQDGRWSPRCPNDCIGITYDELFI
jgi:hypothetical protein